MAPPRLLLLLLRFLAFLLLLTLHVLVLLLLALVVLVIVIILHLGISVTNASLALGGTRGGRARGLRAFAVFLLGLLLSLRRLLSLALRDDLLALELTLFLLLLLLPLQTLQHLGLERPRVRNTGILPLRFLRHACLLGLFLDPAPVL